MDDGQFSRVVERTTIFGRITPEQKQRIIATLRAQGRYVAMTGDGVNDVLALKQAKLGIAMQSGTQAARNVADIVLLGDSFAALPEAFLEGQRIMNGMGDILRLYMTRISNPGDPHRRDRHALGRISLYTGSKFGNFHLHAHDPGLFPGPLGASRLDSPYEHHSPACHLRAAGHRGHRYLFTRRLPLFHCSDR